MYGGGCGVSGAPPGDDQDLALVDYLLQASGFGVGESLGFGLWV